VISFLKYSVFKEAVPMKTHVQLVQCVRNSLAVLHVQLNEWNLSLFVGTSPNVHTHVLVKMC